MIIMKMPVSTTTLTPEIKKALKKNRDKKNVCILCGRYSVYVKYIYTADKKYYSYQYICPSTQENCLVKKLNATDSIPIIDDTTHSDIVHTDDEKEMREEAITLGIIPKYGEIFTETELKSYGYTDIASIKAGEDRKAIEAKEAKEEELVAEVSKEALKVKSVKENLNKLIQNQETKETKEDQNNAIETRIKILLQEKKNEKSPQKKQNKMKMEKLKFLTKKVEDAEILTKKITKKVNKDKIVGLEKKIDNIIKNFQSETLKNNKKISEIDKKIRSINTDNKEEIFKQNISQFNILNENLRIAEKIKEESLRINKAAKQQLNDNLKNLQQTIDEETIELNNLIENYEESNNEELLSEINVLENKTKKYIQDLDIKKELYKNEMLRLQQKYQSSKDIYREQEDQYNNQKKNIEKNIKKNIGDLLNKNTKYNFDTILNDFSNIKDEINKIVDEKRKNLPQSIIKGFTRSEETKSEYRETGNAKVSYTKLQLI
jgi:hypothetical protein